MPSASPKGAKDAQKKLTARKLTAKKAGAKVLGSKDHGPKGQPAKAPSLKLQAAKAHSPKAHVFLVAVKRRRGALRVYAVLTASEAVALAIVEAANGEDVTVEPVGRLSKKLARPLKLLTGEPQPI